MNEQAMRATLDNLSAFTLIAFTAALQRTSGRYSDEHLEHWGEVYAANPALAARGILLAAFLDYPQELLEAVVFRRALPLAPDQEHYPLLPRQRVVAARVDAIEAAEARAESELARATHVDGPGVREAPQLHGEQLIQPRHLRASPSRRKVGGPRG